jgi:hypothetical protein
MNFPIPIVAGACVMLIAASVHAQDAAPPKVIEHPAPAPAEGDSGLEPEITITERGETVIEEHRIGGQLYAIKIIPKKGVPYYLVDSDGDGNMERRTNELVPSLLIPSWVLLRWR